MKKSFLLKLIAAVLALLTATGIPLTALAQSAGLMEKNAELIEGLYYFQNFSNYYTSGQTYKEYNDYYPLVLCLYFSEEYVQISDSAKIIIERINPDGEAEFFEEIESEGIIVSFSSLYMQTDISLYDDIYDENSAFALTISDGSLTTSDGQKSPEIRKLFGNKFEGSIYELYLNANFQCIFRGVRIPSLEYAYAGSELQCTSHSGNVTWSADNVREFNDKVYLKEGYLTITVKHNDFVFFTCEKLIGTKSDEYLCNLITAAKAVLYIPTFLVIGTLASLSGIGFTFGIGVFEQAFLAIPRFFYALLDIEWLSNYLFQLV